MIFSVLNSAVLRPLPYRDAEQLVQIWDRRTEGGNIFTTGLAFKYWRDENTQLETLAACDVAPRTLTGGRSAERTMGLSVSASYLGFCEFSRSWAAILCPMPTNLAVRATP